jgi:hypothetical protein
VNTWDQSRFEQELLALQGGNVASNFVLGDMGDLVAQIGMRQTLDDSHMNIPPSSIQNDMDK